MKSYSKVLSMAMVIAGVIASCDKVDPPPQDPLHGTWKEVDESYSNCTNPASNKPKTVCAAPCVSAAITATTITFCDSAGCDNFTYTRNGSTLILTPSLPGTSTYEISADGKTLIFTFQFNASAGNNLGNCLEVVTYTKI